MNSETLKKVTDDLYYTEKKKSEKIENKEIKID